MDEGLDKEIAGAIPTLTSVVRRQIADVLHYNQSNPGQGLSLPKALMVAYPLSDFVTIPTNPRADYRTTMIQLNEEALSLGEDIWNQVPTTAWAMPSSPTECVG